jgi:hypothetical protein
LGNACPRKLADWLLVGESALSKPTPAPPRLCACTVAETKLITIEATAVKEAENTEFKPGKQRTRESLLSLGASVAENSEIALA